MRFDRRGCARWFYTFADGSTLSVLWDEHASPKPCFEAALFDPDGEYVWPQQIKRLTTWELLTLLEGLQ